jgi:hypothetical protein
MAVSRTIFDVAKDLNLSAQDFRELVDLGRLDGCQLDDDCIERVRRMLLNVAKIKPPATRH